MVRPEIVSALSEAMLDTLTQNATGDATASEMFSAVLTLMGKFVSVLLAMGANPQDLRAALNKVLIQLPSPSERVH